jgi:regulator of sigma E protease
MFSALYYAGSFIVAIALLIAVHEFGHFWVARRLGFKVLRFSIGFGRPIWRWRGADGTEYWLSRIPLGGYVKLLDEREGPVPVEEQHLAFNRRPIPHRIAVLLAGPGFNFLFAICAYWALFVAGVPGIKPYVGEVTPGSPAAEAGLLEEDLILSVDARPVETWQGTVLALLDSILDGGDVSLQVMDSSGDKRRLMIDLRDKAAELTEPDALFPGIGITPLMPKFPAVIGEVVAGEPAERAGFLSDDKVITAGDESIDSWGQWLRFVRDRPGENVTVTVQRGTSVLDLDLGIGIVEENGRPIGRIGAAPNAEVRLAAAAEARERFTAEQRYPVGTALLQGAKKTWGMSALTLRMLWRMVIGDVSVKNLSGPINIATYAGNSAQAGIGSFTMFLALISISLGIINLMPIPLLDGGQVLYQLVEAVKGSPMSERSLIVGQQVGIVLLLLVMSVAFYNDLSRIFVN